MNQLTQTWIDKWYETQGQEAGTMTATQGAGGQTPASIGLVIRSQVPYLVGMALDVLKTGLVVHELKDGITRFGLGDKEHENQKVLKGPDVLPNHCQFENLEGEVTLYPEKGAVCVVNGVDIEGPTKLYQGDTVLLGKTNMFTFSLPAESQIPLPPLLGLQGTGDPRRSWEQTSTLASSAGSLSDLPSPVSKAPRPRMFDPSVEVENSFQTEVEKIQAA
ncbi:kinesin-like protein, partial [Plakobranchus ocellatus]